MWSVCIFNLRMNFKTRDFVKILVVTSVHPILHGVSKFVKLINRILQSGFLTIQEIFNHCHILHIICPHNDIKEKSSSNLQ